MTETVTIDRPSVAKPVSRPRPRKPTTLRHLSGVPAQALRREERRMHPASLSEHKFCWLLMPGRATKKSPGALAWAARSACPKRAMSVDRGRPEVDGGR